jgi:hypothetical protein
MSDAERAELGLRARTSVMANYTTEAMQNATMDVYRELME